MARSSGRVARSRRLAGVKGAVGFLSRIFGTPETDEQKLDRARAAIADNEPDLALRILMRVEGTEASELMELARDKIRGREIMAPAPVARPILPGLVDLLAAENVSIARVSSAGGMTFTFDADGSQRITSPGSAIVLNKPRTDDDGRKRSRDGLEVARRLVDDRARDERELELPAFPFVDAVFLLARAGESIPAIDNPRRRRLAAMCKAAAVHDHELVMTLARGDQELSTYVVPLVLPFAPLALATFAPDNLMVLRAVAAVDRDAGNAMLARIPDDLVGHALLVAMDAGLDAEPLHERWRSLAKPDDPKHQALEIRRLARTDLDVALGREAELESHDDDVSLAVAARLAKVEPVLAIRHATELGPDCYHQGWLTGCVRGAGIEAADLLDTWIEHLSPATYHPYAFFGVVLEASMRLGDAERVRRVCERGGPMGWQIAHAARWELGRSPNRAELLEALLARYRPGCVSARGRERSGGPLTVGMCVTRPQWLELERPHPVETLSIVAALGTDGPAWGDDALP
jgi:hypothetical protein